MKTRHILPYSFSGIMPKVLILFFVVFLISFSSCKSKKPIITDDEEQLDEVNTEVIKAKASLQKIFDDNNLSIEEKEKILNEVKAQNLNDEELNNMIAKAEVFINNKKEEIERKKEAVKPENKLLNYFDKIANASSTEKANEYINDALQMFSSPLANVLIIISDDGHIKDYDKPTNIKKYLNQIKDTKRSSTKVDEIKWDANKKIKTLILRKIK